MTQAELIRKVYALSKTEGLVSFLDENKGTIAELREIQAKSGMDWDEFIEVVNAFCEAEIEKPRRGRPPKAETEEAPKRRGRPPKEKVETKDNAPDGPFWGEEGKPTNLAEARKQYENTNKPRKLAALKKLIGEFAAAEAMGEAPKRSAKAEGEPKRRGRPPGSKNKPKEEEPKRVGRPPGTKMDHAPNPQGIWGEAGKPTDINEAKKRLRKATKERVRKMLSNLIEKMRREAVRKTDKARKLATKVGKTYKRRSAGSREEAPQRAAAA